MTARNVPGGCEVHPERDSVLDEVHARPFTPIASPARVLLFGFQTDGEMGHADRKAAGRLCQAHGRELPRDGVNHHRVDLGALTLRWEQHAEFTTYTWELPGDAEAALFDPPASTVCLPMSEICQPGPLLAAIDLQLITHEESALELFDPARARARGAAHPQQARHRSLNLAPGPKLQQQGDTRT